MKFTVERTTFFKALLHAQSIVEKKNTIPILANVKITADSDGIKLQSTNTDIEVVERIDGMVDTKGSVTASATKLYVIASKLHDGSQISFSYDEKSGQLKGKSGSTKFSLMTLPVEEFYAMPDSELPFTFSMAGAELRDIVNRTSFAVATEETRHYLTGIYMHDNSKDRDKTLRVAATDGHRLACLEVTLPEGAEGIPGVIIPKKTMQEVVKLMDGTDQDVEISLSQNRIRFNLKDIVFTSKLIEGTYPDYEKVIPTNNDKRMEVSAADMKSAVDKASAFSEKARGIKVFIGKGKVNVSTNIPEEGGLDDEIDSDYNDEAIEFSFNHKYLLDILEQVKSGRAAFTFSDSPSPVVIYDGEDTTSVYVLMPMRI